MSANVGKGEQSTTITFRLPAPLKLRLEAEAKKAGMDTSHLVRMLVAQQLPTPLEPVRTDGRCGLCHGLGIMEDPQHGHALRCGRCGGSGVE